MKSFKLLAFAAAAAMPSVSHAQMAVIDHSSLAKALETARNTLNLIDKAQDQINEARRLYDAANRLTDIGAIASDLGGDFISRGMPDDIRDTIELTKSDLDELGSLGARAKELLRGNGLRETATSVAAARDQAIAENDLEIARQTSKGINVLRDRLQSAGTDKEVSDLQARTMVEVAQILNHANQQAALREAQGAVAEQQAIATAERQSRLNRTAIEEGRILPRLEK